MIRKLAATIALAAVSVAGIAGLADLAGASQAKGVIKAPTASYTSPSKASAPVHFLQQNESVETRCFTEGQEVNGNAFWFRIDKDGQPGYVHRDAIAPPAGLRHC